MVTTMSGATNQLLFRLKENPLKGPIRLEPTWTDVSAGSCSTTCMVRFTKCRSFMFNHNTGLCSPGSWINSQQPVPTEAEGDLYHSFECDESKNFTLYTHSGITACISLPGQKLSYQRADQACSDMGGFLASVKTKEKLYLIVSLFGTGNQVWIGCDELDVTGTYVWKEDGEVFQIPSPLLGVSQPDNHDGPEDCLSIQLDGEYLGDWLCSMEFYFACEISVP